MSNHNIHTEIRTITPEWATQKIDEHLKRLEAGSFKQRPINKETINKYAVDMRNGNWALTGQGLSWDEDGNLLDGQHRLYAVIRAGIPVKMLIITGLPVTLESGNRIKTLETFDTGRPRSFGQQLRLEGVEYCIVKASISRLLAILSSGLLMRKISTVQGWAIIKLHEAGMDKVITTMTQDNQMQNMRGYILAPIVLLRASQPELVDRFIKEYTELTGLDKKSPVLALHKYLSRPFIKTRGTDYQIMGMMVVATALYYFCTDQQSDFLRGSKEGVEWLLSDSKNAVKQIQKIIGEDITLETLQR